MQGTRQKVEQLNVLLIEDNPDDAEFLEDHLQRVRRRKITIECCDLLSSGLRRLTAGGIDTIFLDLSLPDSSGLDTLTRVHKDARGVPIIVLTGTDDDELAVRALELGAQDYLVKGQLDPSSLGRSINYAIERQNATNISQWLASLIECSTDAIIGKSLQNIILSWNQGAEDMYGYKASEVLGKSIEMLLPPGHQNDFAQILEIIKRGEKISNHETRGLTKDGRVIFVSLSASPIRDAKGIVTDVSVIARDITQQKLDAEAFRETALGFKAAIEASRLGIWSWDIVTGNLKWDDRMFELFGTTRERFDLTCDKFTDLIHPDDRQRVQDNIEMVISEGADYEVDYQVLWSDGTIRDIHAKGELFCNEQSNPVQITGVCLDVTERKRAERALADSEERLRLALDSAEMGVWDWDMINDSVWRSSKNDEIFGTGDSTRSEWTLGTFLDHVIPEDRAGVEEVINLSFASGKFYIECRIKHAKDLCVRWICAQGKASKNENGKPARMMGTVTDITERKQLAQLALDNLKSKDQIARAVLQHAPVGIVTLDADLNVLDANAAFISMIDRNLDELIQQPLRLIPPYELFESAQKSINSRDPRQVSRLQVTIQKQHSTRPRHWDLSLWPVENNQGELATAILQVVDRTDMVLLEQQRDDFVASVAHDIKNPLIAAERIFEMLCNQSQDAQPEKNARIFSALRDSNQNLLSMVQNLVDVYRYETLDYPCHYEDLDLHTLVNSCIEQMAHFAESRNVTVVWATPDSHLRIECDAIGVRRVVMNLLHNAIKFNKPGGTVEVGLNAINDVMKIRVADTGSGINESEKESLFQRFVQGDAGKGHTGGTGLGLYLSKQIVQALQGDITCESRIGFGTTFVVSLPLAATSNPYQGIPCA